MCDGKVTVIVNYAEPKITPAAIEQVVLDRFVEMQVKAIRDAIQRQGG